MKSNSLELQDLVVMREGAPLTPPITLTLDAGQMLAIHGSNGSGKSTLLRMLAGLIPAPEGRIAVKGQWPAAHPALYIGHRNGLAPEMSVADNVALWATLTHNRELIDAAIHYFELDDIADVPVSRLSAGWQQRVTLTRLITIQSSLWLLDEPTANLDTSGTALLQSLMQARLEQGGIIVIATHTQLEGEMIKTLNFNEINYNHKVA